MGLIRSLSVLTPSVVCFILWAIQTPNRSPTLAILCNFEKICGMGEVYLTISSHKTRTDVRTKLNFPCCALEFMWYLSIWISIAEQKWTCLSGIRSFWLFLFVVVSHFTSFRSIQRQWFFSFSFSSFSLCALNLLT